MARTTRLMQPPSETQYDDYIDEVKSHIRYLQLLKDKNEIRGTTRVNSEKRDEKSKFDYGEHWISSNAI